MEAELGEGPPRKCSTLHGGLETEQREQIMLVENGGPEAGTEPRAESEGHPCRHQPNMECQVRRVSTEFGEWKQLTHNFGDWTSWNQ